MCLRSPKGGFTATASQAVTTLVRTGIVGKVSINLSRVEDEQAMNDQTYNPETEEESGDRSWLFWAGGAAIAVALVACACLFCLGLSTLIYLDSAGYFEERATEAPNQPPKPVIAYSKEAMVGQTVPFDGSASEPGSSPISGYEWNFGDGTTASGAVTSHVYNASGVYQVTLTVTDQEGFATTGGPVEITVMEGTVPQPTPTPGQPVPATPVPETTSEPPPEGSQPPEPVLNYPLQASVGQEVTFDGSGSRPGSSPIASYEWDLGDGTTASGAIVTHVYSTPGNYPVTLIVTGQDGQFSTGGPVQIEVKGEGEIIEPTSTSSPPAEGVPSEPPAEGSQYPVPLMAMPAEAMTGDEITFDGSTSRPGASPIASYEWDFGDGTMAEGAVVTHIYNIPGAYQVTLLVTGEDEFASVGGPQEIIILQDSEAGPPPASGDAPEPIMIIPATVQVGVEITIDGSQSRPGSSPIESYNWSFGDGSVGRGMVVPYTYDEAGVYQVTLTVVDQDGRTSISDPTDITVEEEEGD
jgi:PKD repeat protein